jgi:hypothetical protein
MLLNVQDRQVTPLLNSRYNERYPEFSPDGRRFLMVKYEEMKPQPITEVVFIHDWFEQLNALSGKR